MSQKNELERLKKASTTSAAELSSFTEKYHSLVNEHENLQAAVASRNENAEAAALDQETKLHSLEASSAEFKEKLESLQQAKDSLEKSKSKEIEQLTERLDATTRDLKVQAEALHKERTEKEIVGQEYIEKQKAYESEYYLKMDKMENALHDHKETAVACRRELSTCQTKLSTCKGELDSATKTIADLEAKIVEIASRTNVKGKSSKTPTKKKSANKQSPRQSRNEGAQASGSPSPSRRSSRIQALDSDAGTEEEASRKRKSRQTSGDDAENQDKNHEAEVERRKRPAKKARSSKGTSSRESRNIKYTTICFTGLKTPSKKVSSSLEKLNIKIAPQYSPDVTHIVMQDEHTGGRTIKLGQALAVYGENRPCFVTESWVQESIRAGQLMDENSFLPSWPSNEEKKHGVKWKATIQKFNRRTGPLFAG